MKRILGVLLALSVILSACSAQTTKESSVRAIQDIPGGIEGPTISDDHGTSVVIRFSTGVPTMCNVAYGTDANYGTLAMMAMMGGATRDHEVTLGGLTPNTTYHYRISLTDQQARLYQSEDLTFSTGAAATPAPEGDADSVASLAAGARVVGVSSNFGGGPNTGAFGANSAIDGDPSTAWSSNGDGDDAWIEIELPQRYHVRAIGFWTRTMGDGTAQIVQFSVTTDQGVVLEPFDLPDADRLYTFPVEANASRLRFDAEQTSGGNTGAVEIHVIGDPAGPDS